MARSHPLVSFWHVGCSYGGGAVVEDVTFSVDEGDYVGLVGPSGSGKTTVLRALLGAIEPIFGTVERRAEVRVGYVPQVETIDWTFPVTAVDVVTMAIARRRFGPLPAAERDRVLTLLDRLGVGDVAGRHIAELSGGQQQRVFVARALASDPHLLVLDEPSSGIDVATRHELLHLLAELHRDGVAIVLTTHDVNGLAAHLPRLICFNRTVIADGRPDEVLHPYVLERTYGASMEVLRHGGMPIVVDRHRPHVAEHAG